MLWQRIFVLSLCFRLADWQSGEPQSITSSILNWLLQTYHIKFKSHSRKTLMPDKTTWIYFKSVIICYILLSFHLTCRLTCRAVYLLLLQSACNCCVRRVMETAGDSTCSAVRSRLPSQLRLKLGISLCPFHPSSHKLIMQILPRTSNSSNIQTKCVGF